MGTFYHYSGCSTCRKALSFLRASGVALEAVDLVTSPPDAATLARIWRASGLPLGRLFNTSGESYRAGDFRTRLATMSEAEQLAALAADGKLVKRPILDLGDRARVGFDEAGWREVLGIAPA